MKTRIKSVLIVCACLLLTACGLPLSEMPIEDAPASVTYAVFEDQGVIPSKPLQFVEYSRTLDTRSTFTVNRFAQALWTAEGGYCYGVYKGDDIWQILWEELPTEKEQLFFGELPYCEVLFGYHDGIVYYYDQHNNFIRFDTATGRGVIYPEALSSFSPNGSWIAHGYGNAFMAKIPEGCSDSDLFLVTPDGEIHPLEGCNWTRAAWLDDDRLIVVVREDDLVTHADSPTWYCEYSLSTGEARPILDENGQRIIDKDRYSWDSNARPLTLSENGEFAMYLYRSGELVIQSLTSGRKSFYKFASPWSKADFSNYWYQISECGKEW